VSRPAASLPTPPYSRSEELAHTLTAGLGIVACAIAIPWLAWVAAGDALRLAGAMAFGTTALAMFSTSVIYHWESEPARKQRLRKLDHSAIYLLIAGTYTPFTLVAMQGAWGWSLFGVVWGLAVLGVTAKLLNRLSHPILSTGLYVAMGWVAIAAAGPLLNRMPAAGLAWLVAGGVAYTAGAVVFLFDSRIRYAHFAWHMFVLAGSSCHFFAALWYSR